MRRDGCLDRLLAALFLAAWALAPAVASGQIATLIPSGVSQANYLLNVQQSIFRDPVIVWHSQPGCSGVIGAGLPGGPAPGVPGDELEPSVLWRGSTLGVTPRKLFEFNPTRPVGTCNPHRLLSNVAVDETHVYYVDNLGPGGNAAIWRRSRDANVGDASQLLRNLGVPASGISGVELLTFGISLFALVHTTNSLDILAQYHKETGGVFNSLIDGGSTNSLRNLQFDGRYLYWIKDNNLIANDTTNGNKRTAVFNVANYVAEGYDDNCSPLGCEPYALVTYGENNRAAGNRLITTDIIGGFTSLNYTAQPNYSFGGMARGGTDHFFFLRGPAPFGGPFDREERLLRLPVGLTTPTLIYGPFVNHVGFDGFVTDFAYLYFRDRGARSLLRLPNNVAGIPIRQLRATGLEVTQGIQGPGNDVMLVSGRRTHVRFYVRSDGPTDVGGVSARLAVFGPNGFLGVLEPVNGVNKLLNVLRTPFRRNLGDSFLFELPLAWTDSAYLSFSATVNPGATILEDTYANNGAQTPILILSESPRLPLETISWWYNRNNALVTGNTYNNFRSEWHLRNLYPIAYSGGGIGQTGPGLRTASRIITDNALQPQVDQTNMGCINTRGPTATNPTDNRNQCAADYVMAQVRALKAAGTLPNDRYYYSAIAGDATTPFTRGYAITSERSASGPMTDTVAGGQQNYMAHEVGHLLGRNHPGSGAAPVCPGQDGADPAFPNPQARIGSSTTVANDEAAHMFLDPGEFTTSTRTLRPSSTSGDTMSYCPPHGISRYHYEAMWLWMSLLNPLGAGLPRAAGAPQAAAIPGDWLLAHGTLSAATLQATFASVQRRDAVAEVPPLVAGGYRLELRSASGGLLASHDFTPDEIEDGAPGHAGFGLVVPFEPGTRSLRIVKASGQVMANHSVSANPPVVGDVGLVGAAEPVDGVVDVAWTASDPDGDDLSFDLFYSHDDGASWRPVQLSLGQTSTEVDTAGLPGGTGRFRVEASDGAQRALAESAPFEVLRKAPHVSIDSPADGTRIAWGQLVNFVASVEDPQGGSIPAANLVWSNAYRVLGTGPTVSVTDLEVGENLVTLEVTDATGLPSFATVTVAVGDDVKLPGPRLSAAPSPITWQVPGNSSAVLSSDLQVRNAGGGQLPFRVTSSAPWLLVNGLASVTRSADSSLSVMADASALPEPAVSEAQLTIENLADPADVLVVPVALFKGSLAVATPFSDADGDGVDDLSDDCLFAADGPDLPGDPVLDQRDTDGDGYGNACDADLNNDGIVNFADLARMRLVFFSSDPDADLTGDGVVNFADLARLRTGFLKAPGPSAKAP